MIWFQIKAVASHCTGACHQCTCPMKRFLEIKSWQLKSTKQQKQRVLDAASGKTIATEPVVTFNGEGEGTTAGPAAKSYERLRTAAGAHLIFNAFWLITSFRCYQMYMRDSLHQVCLNRESEQKKFGLILDGNRSIQVDHGIIIHVLRGIFCLYFGKTAVNAAIEWRAVVSRRAGRGMIENFGIFIRFEVHEVCSLASILDMSSSYLAFCPSCSSTLLRSTMPIASSSFIYIYSSTNTMIQCWSFVSPCDETLVHSNKSSRRRRRHGCVPPDTWGIEISDGLTLASSNAQGM